MHSNLSYLQKMSGGNSGFVNDMIQLFLKQLPVELEKLQQAIATSDHDTTKHLVHKLKSSVAMMGAEGMVAELKQMETLLRSTTDMVQLWEPYNNLEKNFEKVKLELEPLVQ